MRSRWLAATKLGNSPCRPLGSWSGGRPVPPGRPVCPPPARAGSVTATPVVSRPPAVAGGFPAHAIIVYGVVPGSGELGVSAHGSRSPRGIDSPSTLVLLSGNPGTPTFLMARHLRVVTQVKIGR